MFPHTAPTDAFCTRSKFSNTSKQRNNIKGLPVNKRYEDSISPSWVRFGRHKRKQSGSPFSTKHCQKLNRTLNTSHVKATEGQR